jgi:hypothetical protein
MPFAISPLAKVSALFFAQGVVLWLLMDSFDDPGFYWRFRTVFIALNSWWALWVALHPQRTWQPWLECLVVMGATYWVPVFGDALLRFKQAYESWDPPQYVIAYQDLWAHVVLTFPLALLLRGVSRKTGWRLQAPSAAGEFGLRKFFLLTPLVALHVLAFQPMLKEFIDSRPWLGFGTHFYWTSLASLLRNFSVAIVVLGVAMWVLGPRPQNHSVRFMALGSLAMLVVTGFFTQRLVWTLYDGSFVLMIACAMAFINAVALREIGYRMVRADSEPVNDTPGKPTGI